MGVDVQLRTEGGEVLESLPDDRFVVAKATGDEFTGTRLLQYVVPWGDAVFNQAQAADIANDICQLRCEHQGSDLAEHLRKVEPLVKKLSSGSYLYLWFVGD